MTRKSSSWRDEAKAMRVREAQAPAGCQSIDDIARELDTSEENALKIVAKLVKAGRAERVPGKKLTITGALVACNYYRLVGKPAS